MFNLFRRREFRDCHILLIVILLIPVNLGKSYQTNLILGNDKTAVTKNLFIQSTVVAVANLPGYEYDEDFEFPKPPTRSSNDMSVTYNSAPVKLNQINEVRAAYIPGRDYDGEIGFQNVQPKLGRLLTTQYCTTDACEGQFELSRQNSPWNLGQILLNALGVGGIGLLYIQQIVTALNIPSLIPALFVQYIFVIIAVILIPIIGLEPLFNILKIVV